MQAHSEPRSRARRAAVGGAVAVSAAFCLLAQGAVVTTSVANATTTSGQGHPEQILGWMMSEEFPDLSRWPGVLGELID